MRCVQVEPVPRPNMTAIPAAVIAHPAPEHHAGRKALDDRAGRERHDEAQHGRGQQPRAAGQRRVAEVVLQVQGQVGVHREHPRRRWRTSRARRRRTPACGTASGRTSAGSGAARRRRTRPSGRPSRRAATTISPLPQPSSLPRRSPRISRNSAPAKVTRPAMSSRSAPGSPMLRIRAAASAHGHDPDRHVDEEDPAPAEAVGERAADQRPDGDRGADGRAPGGDRPAAVGAVVVLPDQRQAGGEHRRLRRAPAPPAPRSGRRSSAPRRTGATRA